MSRLALPLALLLLLAGGLFFLLNDPQSDHDAAQQQGTESGGQERADGLANPGSDVVAADPSRLDQVERQGASSRPQNLAASLAAANKGLLKVRVVGRKGQAAQGVEVSLFRHNPNTDFGGFVVSDGGPAPEPEARVEAVDGYVSFEVESGQDWRLRAHGGHWGEANLNVNALHAGEIVDLGGWRLEPADQIRGVVRNPQGQAVAQAQVILTASGSTMFEGGGRIQAEYTDSRGQFVFEGVEAGRYKVEARATGYQLGVVEPIAAAGQGQDLEVIVPLQEGRSVKGVVLDPDNQPIAGAIIRPQRRMIDLMVSRGDRHRNGALPPGAVESDANGRFEMSGLGDGLANLRVSASGFAPTSVVEQAGGAELVARMQPTLTLAGVLLLADGTPAANQDLALAAADEEFDMLRMPGQQMRVITNERGEFRFEGVDPGEWTPQASHPGGQLRMQPQPFLASQQDLRWQMESAEHLLVRVMHEGKPVPGARVRVAALGFDGPENIIIEQNFDDGDGGGTHRVMGGRPPTLATADAFGYALLPGVAPGGYEIRVNASGFATKVEQLERREGAQELELSLELACRLHVLVQDSIGEVVSGVEVMLRPLEAQEGTPEAKLLEKTSDAAGRAVWTDLASGRYELSYRAGELGGGMSFSIMGMDEPVQSGHVVSVVDVQAETPQELTITVDALATVEVLALRQGKPAAGVEVWLSEELEEDSFGFGGKQSRKQWTDESGRVRMEPVSAGAWTLVARGSADAVKIEQSLTLQPGHQQSEIEISGATLSGVLMSANGPVVGAKVSLQKIEEGEEDQPRSRAISVVVMDNGDGGAMEMGMDDGALARAVSAADGSFVLRDLPAGSWQIEVKAKGYGKWTSEPIAVNQHQDQNLGVRQLVAECTIGGLDHSFDTEASGPGRFSGVSIIQLEDEQGGNQGIAMPQSDGSYRFGGLAPGKYRVTRGSYRSDLLDLSPGQQLTHDLPK